MRPIPIDETSVPEGARRTVVLPPDGDLTNSDIGPVEAVTDDDGFHVLIALEPEDFTCLSDQAKATGQACFWLHFHVNRMPVFSLTTPTIEDGSFDD